VRDAEHSNAARYNWQNKMTTRREVLKGLTSAALARPCAGLEADLGMLSAGYIVRRRGLVHSSFGGSALHPNGRLQPFGEQCPFRVASVSKMITTLGFMTLVRRGAIDLDADVSNHLGVTLRHPAYPALTITPRMLLSHTSGLRNGADFPVPFNHSLLQRLSRATAEPEFGGWFAPSGETPGSWFAYSDTNFAVVGEIIERLTGVRFDLFMHQTIFAPSRLDIGYNWSGVPQTRRSLAAAGCHWQDGRWQPNVDANPPRAPDVALYREDGDVTSTVADYRVGENGFAFAPHGGLRLSLSDMDRLARQFLFARDTLDQATPVWTFTPDAPNGATYRGFYQAYGLGMQIPLGRATDSFFGPDSSDWRGHCGDAYGWMTGLWWNARMQTTLVYAINGMPETDRRESTRTAMTDAEQSLIDRALREVGLGSDSGAKAE
jgi:CubicO group peptidase (beta-lactamase class C family)